MSDAMKPSLTETNRTVGRSGFFDADGRELVLACGYSEDGFFGYFITYEHKLDRGFYYAPQRAFVRKINENSYQEALTRLKEIVEAEKQQPCPVSHK